MSANPVRQIDGRGRGAGREPGSWSGPFSAAGISIVILPEAHDASPHVGLYPSCLPHEVEPGSGAKPVIEKIQVVTVRKKFFLRVLYVVAPGTADMHRVDLIEVLRRDKIIVFVVVNDQDLVHPSAFYVKTMAKWAVLQFFTQTNSMYTLARMEGSVEYVAISASKTQEQVGRI